MCAVSVIYDMFSKLPDTWFTAEHISLYRNMVEDAKTFDLETNQADCEDPEKAKVDDHINQLEKQLDGK